MFKIVSNFSAFIGNYSSFGSEARGGPSRNFFLCQLRMDTDKTKKNINNQTSPKRKPSSFCAQLKLASNRKWKRIWEFEMRPRHGDSPLGKLSGETVHQSVGPYVEALVYLPINFVIGTRTIEVPTWDGDLRFLSPTSHLLYLSEAYLGPYYALLDPLYSLSAIICTTRMNNPILW